MMKSVLRKHTECAEALLPASDLNIRNRRGHLAFHVCVSTANEECFELLLPLMSDVDARTFPGYDASGQKDLLGFNHSALHIACMHGQRAMCKALLKKANWMAKDNFGRTPLHKAAQSGSLSCCVLLVDKMTPQEVNEKDVDGWTPLHFAAQQGSVQVVGVLLEAGARLDAKTSSEGTPLGAARHYHPTNTMLHALLSGGGPAALPGTVCNYCGMTAEQASVECLKNCLQCQAARYCGAACQKAAWPAHKAACRAKKAEMEAKAQPNIVLYPQPQ